MALWNLAPKSVKGGPSSLRLRRWALFQPCRDVTSPGGWFEVGDSFFSAASGDFLVFPVSERRSSELNLAAFLSSSASLLHVSFPL